MGTMFAIWGLCMAIIGWMIWNMPERKMLCIPVDQIILQRIGDITKWKGLRVWNGRANQVGPGFNNFEEFKGDLVHVLIWRP